jgi:acyl carrier protein
MSANDRSHIEKSIIDFLTQRFPELGDDVGLSTALLEKGAIDSLGILELMLFLGEHHGVAISDDDFVPENFATVATLASFVAEKRSASL